MIELDNVSTYYGEFMAINNISMKIGKGEFVTVIGPNGHGKSTLLKTICGLLTPKSGSLVFMGKNITGIPTYKIVEMGLIYVAEERHLFPEMSVIENLKLGAYCKNARKKEKDNLDFVFELFPRLKERNKQLASTLSGGEARMLAIGRGLMSNASMLAIDEPSLGLAPNLRMDVFEKISEINKSGVTVLMVEQSIAEAVDIIDRFYLLEDGHIIFEGDKNQMYSDAHVREIFLGV